MSIRIKPKSYGPLSVSAIADGSIQSVSEAGHRIAVGLKPDATASSPSDLVLSALGSCIYISTGMAATALGLAIDDMSVEVQGHKAEDLPHRIQSFEVNVSFDLQGKQTVPPDDVERILKKTKELCTISNTLAADIKLTYLPPQ